ncbi:oligopeptidase A [Pseudomonas gingeri]|uniref:Oligopeptidase A n=1 Tax=Pseudomonas gingeri TaxID=117681 RepID=A0A7Y8C259_9PSED|nr:oligopeptidase A [Pseudomonas gingeri]
MDTYNPLLHHCGKLLPYSSVQPRHLKAAMAQIRDEAHGAIEAIIASQQESPTWDDFVVPLDALNARMSWCQGVIQVLSSARSGEDWGKAFKRCARIGAQFERMFWSDSQLHALYQKLADSPLAQQFDRSRRTLLDRVLRRFRMAGMDLPADQRQRFKVLGQAIDELRLRFLGNVVQAARCTSLLIGVEQEAQLEGLSVRDKASMALYQGEERLGWWIDMGDPQLFRTIMADVRARDLREQVYRLGSTLASDRGLTPCEAFDNSALLEQLLTLRLEQARMLGFGSFAELALESLSVPDIAHVLGFFYQQVVQKAPGWSRQVQALVATAPDPGVQRLEPWDHEFLAQRLRMDSGALEEDEFRGYFELEQVLEKMFDLPRRLFGIDLVERQELDTWHASVRGFEVREFGQTTGYLFLDLFGRDEKPFKSGQMFSLGHRVLSVEGRDVKLPVAVLSCALPIPEDAEPLLLKHGQLRTLFHEFGHCLHQLLDRSETWQLSCIEHSGVDVREFFSRLMERWCYCVDFLVDMGRHHQTGESLSSDQARRLRVFLQTQTWLHESAQLTYSGLDFFLHLLQQIDTEQIRLMTKLCLDLWLLPRSEHDRFIYSFRHLASGYEARYFTYLWTLELATEVFARFEDKGLFDAVQGRRLRAELFTPATSRPLAESVEAFLGQPSKAGMQVPSDPAFKAVVAELDKVLAGNLVTHSLEQRGSGLVG